MSLTPKLRRLLWLVAVLLVLGGALVALRYWLGGYAVRSVLRLAGASEIRYTAVRATPWHVEVEGLEFRVRTQPFAARRVVLDREHWWMASLGQVRIEGAQVPVFIDGSDVDPLHWAAYENAGPDGGVDLPFVSVDLDGQLIVRMASLPDVPLDVKLEGRPKGGASWIGSLLVTGPGFRLAGTGSLLRAGQELEFQVLSSELDLAAWSRQLQRFVPLPGAPWQLAGKLTGVGEGRVTAKRFAATARVSLRDGSFKVGTQDIAAGGVEADLEFSDLWKYRTRSAELRMADFRIGQLDLRDVAVDFNLWGAKTLIVNGARGAALGGTVTTDAFRYYLDQRDVGLTLHVQDIDPEQLLRLAPEVPVKLPGRLDGTLPLRVHGEGVRLQTGFLALQAEVKPDFALNALAVVRSGAVMDDATLKVLKAAGAEPVHLKLGELRLDIRPRDAPFGSSARVHLAGETEGGAVAFDYNVNGAIERYLRVLP
jgi:hypothetical protein